MDYRPIIYDLLLKMGIIKVDLFLSNMPYIDTLNKKIYLGEGLMFKIINLETLRCTKTMKVPWNVSGWYDLVWSLDVTSNYMGVYKVRYPSEEEKILWLINLKDYQSNIFYLDGEIKTLSMDKDRMVVQTDKKIFFIDLKNKKIIKSRNEVGSGYAILHFPYYIVFKEKNIYLFDAENGEKLLSYTWCSPVTDPFILYNNLWMCGRKKDKYIIAVLSLAYNRIIKIFDGYIIGKDKHSIFVYLSKDTVVVYEAKSLRVKNKMWIENINYMRKICIKDSFLVYMRKDNKICCMNLNTQKVLWERKIKEKYAELFLFGDKVWVGESRYKPYARKSITPIYSVSLITRGFSSLKCYKLYTGELLYEKTPIFFDLIKVWNDKVFLIDWDELCVFQMFN